MKFASAIVKALFLMGSVTEGHIFDSHSNAFLDSKRTGKMITFNAKKGSVSKFGGLLPSDLRDEVTDFQMSEYGDATAEELQAMIDADAMDERYAGYTLISDDAGMVKKNLDDYKDVQIFAEMYVGSNKQPFDVIFDTGSNWFFVMADDCKNCPIKKTGVDGFKAHESDTYKSHGSRKSLYYGSGSVHGVLAQDTVCLSNDNDDHCVPDFHFVNVKSQRTLDQLKTAGLVGLSPRHYERNADLFVSKMKQGGAIDHSIFSLSIAPGWKQSHVTFGGWDSDAYATDNLKWFNINKWSNYWELGMDKAAFSFLGQERFSLENRRIIIDSGTSYNLMPKADAEIFTKAIEDTMHVQCRMRIVPFCGCTQEQADKWPDLEYTMNGQKFWIPRDSYVVRQNGTCYMKIMYHPSLPVWIMGLNFFQNYYTVFDQESKKIGFAPSIHQDDRLEELMNQDNSYTSLFSMQKTDSSQAVAVVGGLVLVSLIGYVAMNKLKKNQLKKNLNVKSEYESIPPMATQTQS